MLYCTTCYATEHKKLTGKKYDGFRRLYYRKVAARQRGVTCRRGRGQNLFVRFVPFVVIYEFFEKSYRLLDNTNLLG
jgi:hypothetical protein